MQFLLQFPLLVALSSLISASPMRKIQPRGGKSNVNVTKSMYPGINWDDAVKTCDDGQFDKLVESTRMAKEIVNAIPDRVWESAAWNRYFLAEPKLYPNPAHSWIVRIPHPQASVGCQSANASSLGEHDYVPISDPSVALSSSGDRESY